MSATDPEAREAMRARIGETLGEHRYTVDRQRPMNAACTCGWWKSLRLGDDAHQPMRAHLADVLLGLWDGDES